MKMKINFEHLDDPIDLIEHKCNVLVVENNQVFAKILYSLYNRENDYFKLFDDKYKTLSDKKVFTIFNPLQFDFDERSLKTILLNQLVEQLAI